MVSRNIVLRTLIMHHYIFVWLPFSGYPKRIFSFVTVVSRDGGNSLQDKQVVHYVYAYLHDYFVTVRTNANRFLEVDILMPNEVYF